MKAFNNLKVGAKLLGGFLTVAAIILIVAFVGYQNMKSINDGMTTLYYDRTLPIEQLGKAEAYLYKLRGDLYKYVSIPADRTKTGESIFKDLKLIEEQLTLYRATYLIPEEKAELARFDQFWMVYQQDVSDIMNLANSGNEQTALAELMDGTEVSNDRKAVAGAIEKLVAINVQVADEINIEGDKTFVNTTRVMIASGIIGMVIAMGLGIFLSHRITKPLQQATQAAQMIADVDMQNLADEMRALAQGDLTRGLAITAQALVIGSSDEVGQLANAFNSMIARLQETGNAFGRMTANLHTLVREVAESASSLGAASEQLASAANQAGQATGQISTTIQQVAKSTAEQSESVNRTAASVEQMSRAIDGVARGAQDQTQSVSRAVEITSQINTAIQQVSVNAQAGAKGSEKAAEVAEGGPKW